MSAQGKPAAPAPRQPMSFIDQLATGQPAQSPIDPRADFIATRNRAGTGSGSTSFIDQLATESDTPAPGAPTKPTAPPASNLPVGLQFENWVKAAGQRAVSMAYVPEGQRQDKTLGDALRGGIEGIPSEVGSEFMDAMGQLKRDTLPSNWHELFDALQSPVPGGKQALDVLNAAFTPITGALTSAVGRPVEYETGIRRQLTGNLAAMAVPVGGIAKLAGRLGELGDVARAAKGVEGAEGAVAEGAVKPPPPEEPPPPGGPAAKPPPEAAPAAEPGAAAPAAKAAAAAKPAQKTLGFDISGEAPSPNLKPTPEQAADFHRYMTGDSPTSPIALHMETLADPEKTTQAIQDISKMLPRDEVKPVDVTKMNAYALNMTPDEVMGAVKPKFASDEMQAAAQTVLDGAAENFRQLSIKAMESGLPEDRDQALASYTLLNNYVGAMAESGTDLGRAMRIRQEAAGRSSDVVKQIRDMIQNAGPETTPEDIIKRTAAIDDPRKVPGWVATMRKMTARDGILYGYYNYWLSNPAILFKKAASDASLGMFNLASRYTAEKFGLANQAIVPGETAALFHGYTSAWREAIQVAGKALRAGESQFHGEFNSLQDGSLIDRGEKLSEGAPAGFEANQVTRPAFEYIRSLLPTSLIGAADDFAKVMNYRAEINAGAYRTAVKRLGPDANPSDLNELVAQLKNNPPDALHQQALSRALRNTLQEPLDGLAANLQDGIDKFNINVGNTGVQIPLGRMISPFTKISANVLRFAYRSSPLPFAFPTSTWRAEMAAGGATKAMAQAQAGLGTGVSLVALGYVLNGNITGNGPTGQDERYAWLNAGNKPYHIVLPGGWSVPYNKVEPFGTSLGMIADTVELARYAHEEDTASLAASLVLGVGHAMLSKSYMEQWSNLLDAFEDPNKQGQRFVDNFAAGLAVPGIVTGTDHLFDEYFRAHQGLMETIGSRTPGWSNTEPPVRDVWGDPIKRDTGITHGIGRMLLPFDFEPPRDANPIDKWAWENRQYFPNDDQGRMGFTPPGRIFHTEDEQQDLHIPLTTKQADALKVLSGNGYKKDVNGVELGAKDALNALVTGKYPDPAVQAQFDGKNKAAQALMLVSMFNGYRSLAKKYFAAHDPGLKEAIAAGRDTRTKQLTQGAPSPAGGPAPPPAGAAMAAPSGGNAATAPSLGGNP